MSDGLIRLDGYLPVALDGVLGFCQELDLGRLRVDLSSPGAVIDGPVGITLHLHDALTVTARGVITGRSPRREGGTRLEVRIDAYDGEGRGALTGHISSLRKAAHLEIVATRDVESATTRAGWERWRLPHEALPERSADAADLRTTFLGRALRAPLIIAGMTGGSERAGAMNRRLAVVAQELGLGLGLGSQRAMVEAPELAPTFAVRHLAPDILLLANIGAVQLTHGVSIDAVRRLVDDVEADALAVHLNVLQELVQPEGDRDWRGVLAAIEALARALPVPVIAKETGCGIGAKAGRALRDAGVAALDVGGTGGTAWGWIEGFRAADPHRQQIGATFREWGTPTAEALVALRDAVPSLPLMATGGVRSGLDVALALALGADVAGMALPFFRAADASEAEAVALGRRVVEELRIAMTCAGVGAVGALRGLAVRVPS